MKSNITYLAIQNMGIGKCFNQCHHIKCYLDMFCFRKQKQKTIYKQTTITQKSSILFFKALKNIFRLLENNLCIISSQHIISNSFSNVLMRINFQSHYLGHWQKSILYNCCQINVPKILLLSGPAWKPAMTLYCW